MAALFVPIIFGMHSLYEWSHEGITQTDALIAAKKHERSQLDLERSVEDVARTIDFVRENELELSIKGRGHNIAGLAVRNAAAEFIAPAGRAASGFS
mgnify:CR=1 FL=1